MLLKSSWRVVALLAVIGTCVAVAIVIVVLSSGGSDSDSNDSVVASLGQALSVDADPLVVTDLRVVQAATDDTARDQCNSFAGSTNGTSEWIIAGRNLNATTTTMLTPSGTSAFTYLCMHQERVSAVNGSAAETVLPLVLHSVRVLNASSCPTPLTTVFSPRTGVVICGQYIDAGVALATGMYVSDVTSVVEKTYYNTVPGWVTETTPITTVTTGGSSSLAPLYLNYKRPVRPIAAIRVLQTSNTTRACNSQLGQYWEQAGYGGITNDSSNATLQTILCVERAVLNATELAQPQLALSAMLVDVAVVSTTSTCTDGFSDRLELTSAWTLCAKFEPSSASVSYIGELRLQELTTSSSASSSVEAATKSLATGSFRVQAVDTNASEAPVILVYRQHTGITVIESVSSSSGSSASTVSAGSSLSTTTTKSPITARVASPTARQRQLRAQQDSATSTNDGLVFKVMQLADLHFTGDSTYECRNPPQEMIDAGRICTEADTTAFVEQVLDAETPDFVVFSGDNVQVPTGGSIADALASVVGPVEARKIPYALVFGNHDDENGQSREAMANSLIGREYSYMQWGPTSIHGVGNYELSVQAPSAGAWGAAGDDVFRMYFLDSGAYPNSSQYPGLQSTYDWIKPDQVEYYKELALANRNGSATQNSSSSLPAIMYFHIPIPEYASVGTAGYRSGEKNEAVMSPEVNSNLFSALVEMGDVKATFVGHDHINEYCYERQGVQLCYGGGAGFAEAYGTASFARRARVVEWSVDTNNTRRITSWKRHYGSAFATRQLEEVLYQEE